MARRLPSSKKLSKLPFMNADEAANLVHRAIHALHNGKSRLDHGPGYEDAAVALVLRELEGFRMDVRVLRAEIRALRGR